MLVELRRTLIITKREIRDQFRDWRLTIPIFILTMIFPSIMNFTANRMVNFMQRFGAELIAERLIPFLLMVVGFFPISVSLVIALESFVGEKERGSIEPLLTSPLSDGNLYFGKLFAVMIPPLIAAYLGMTVYVYGVYNNLGWIPETDLLILIIALILVQALVMVSGAVVISTQTTSIRAANLLASFIIIPVAFLIQGESVIMFWGGYNTLWWVVFGLAVISWLLVRTGLSFFNREELLGKDLDALNIKWMVNLFFSSFTQKTKSLKAWYQESVFPAVRELKIPFLILVGALIAGFFIGVDQASVFEIPPDFMELKNLDENIIGMNNFSLFQNEFALRSVLFIIFQNLRVLLLATFLGMFTYGVFGVLITILPFAIIGYLSVPIAAIGIPTWKLLGAAVVPHGILEIPAILLAGAAIYKVGARLAAPSGGKSISEGLLHALADWAKIMVGVVVPLLIVAAVVEIIVTPWVVAQVLFP